LVETSVTFLDVKLSCGEVDRIDCVEFFL